MPAARFGLIATSGFICSAARKTAMRSPPIRAVPERRHVALAGYRAGTVAVGCERYGAFQNAVFGSPQAITPER